MEIIEFAKNSSNFICRLDASESKLPLYLRTRKNGDKMSLKGMLGNRKINDIFIDEKITPDERNLWPILVDSDNKIVWLPGLKKSKYDKQKNEKHDIIIKYY